MPDVVLASHEPRHGIRREGDGVVVADADRTAGEGFRALLQTVSAHDPPRHVSPVWSHVVCRKQRPEGMTTDPGEHAGIPRLEHLDGRSGVEMGQLRARASKVGKSCEDATLDRARIMATLRDGPVHPGPVDPPVVVGVPGFLIPRGVVGRAELVTTPDHRYAAEAGDERVTEEESGESAVYGAGISRRASDVEAHEGAARAADPPVACGGVGLESQSASGRPREGAGVPVGEEGAVGKSIESDGGSIGVVDGPPDVVMAAQVGDPRRRG